MYLCKEINIHLHATLSCSSVSNFQIVISCCYEMVHLIPDSYYYSSVRVAFSRLFNTNSVYYHEIHYTADCGHPPVFLNGTVSYQNTTAGSEVHYHCDDSFTLEVEMIVVCRSDGRWSSTPVCRRTTGKMIEQISYYHLQVFPSLF